MTTNATIAIS